MPHSRRDSQTRIGVTGAVAQRDLTDQGRSGVDQPAHNSFASVDRAALPHNPEVFKCFREPKHDLGVVYLERGPVGRYLEQRPLNLDGRVGPEADQALCIGRNLSRAGLSVFILHCQDDGYAGTVPNLRWSLRDPRTRSRLFIWVCAKIQKTDSTGSPRPHYSPRMGCTGGLPPVLSRREIC